MQSLGVPYEVAGAMLTNVGAELLFVDGFSFWCELRDKVLNRRCRLCVAIDGNEEHGFGDEVILGVLAQVVSHCCHMSPEFSYPFVRFEIEHQHRYGKRQAEGAKRAGESGTAEQAQNAWNSDEAVKQQRYAEYAEGSVGIEAEVVVLECVCTAEGGIDLQQ